MQVLPTGMQVFERGWLSANNILFIDPTCTVLVDSGYCTHAQQTLELVSHALDGRPLDLLLNTHLHSDHCGGNAALQARYPDLETRIPPGEAQAVRTWDEEALSYRPTGQSCPRFRFDGLLQPATSVMLGGRDWQVHAAPGHDPDSVMLFEPRSRCLLSADALWRNGFGVIFQELQGEDAFGDVAGTLDVIESLAPAVVVPGHGAVFTDVREAIDSARSRLAAYVSDPRKHAAHAAKVLLKFKLLEWQRVARAEFIGWACATPYFQRVQERYFAQRPMVEWLGSLLDGLVRSGAAAQAGDYVLNA
ncbi:MAG TPA: MBL fold metallo-hydrolase [Ramlibacter sp.]|uniref:MBL fold metallo-hydrolase n=1 Tax=Ramlibacter sp. TaxID=1917967 RepID=UPI002BC76B8B|nr:MBL fold metallo-hydrolase [Ramlibacter sp.]HVZ44102.1 MBL fold metallo-hydrolase [Ramlibacter sp.]